MMIGISGTPGTGKSALARELEKRGYPVTHLVDTIGPYVLQTDQERNTMIVDEEAWAEEFHPVEGIVEGHLAHYLPCDKIIILRCHPDELTRRLKDRGYSEKKILENAEAEALDIVLQETVDRFKDDQIFEIETTHCDVQEVADIVERIIDGSQPPSYGNIDWSPYILETV